MEPIISPWLIYIVYKLNTFIATGIIGGAIAIIAAIVIRIIVGCMRSDLLDETIHRRPARLYTRKVVKNLSRLTKRLCIIGTICLFVAIIFPNRNLFIAMLASKYITPNNLKAAGEAVGEVYKFSREEFLSLLDDVMERIRTANMETEGANTTEKKTVTNNEKVSRSQKEKVM